MLEEARSIVEDFERRPPPVDPEELSETIDLLDWMRENFTFLGYREYEIADEDGEEVLRAVPDSGLGILRQNGRAADLGAASRGCRRTCGGWRGTSTCST